MDFFDINNIVIDEIQDALLTQKNIRLMIARLDQVHPIASGNKLFKLYYFLQEALKTSEKHVITFGGAFSNHLVATAYACNALGLNSMGLVRGEKPLHLSPTLQQCKDLGMQLEYLSREKYAEVASAGISLVPGTIIPEGGYGIAGAKGAARIMDLVNKEKPDYIITATGTATTLAGFLQKASTQQIVISIPVLKNMTDIGNRLQFLNGKSRYDNLDTWHEFHFGGYAKKNEELISFMNNFYKTFQIPTDFVYTGKMMYGVMQKIRENYFKPGSCICCLHTGGLQGNGSLAAGTLVF